jgi:DNA-binding HxlR family transcriptional regulator
MKEIIPRSECPLSYALDLFGDRWTLLILRDMIFFGKCSYSEFLNSYEKIASNILTDRLSSLHANGFVAKHISPSKKSKFLYTLTDKGIALIPAITEIILWADQHTPFRMPQLLGEMLKKNKDKTLKSLAVKLKRERDLLLDQ